MKLKESKSTLEMLEEEIQKRKEAISSEETNTEMSKTWRDKLKIYDEIDKCLNITDDVLKTKKMKDDELEEDIR